MKKRDEAAEEQDLSDILLDTAKKLNFVTLILLAAALGALFAESHARREKDQSHADGERLTLIIGKMHKAAQVEPQKEA